jgi:hypothetical protein
MWLVPRRQRPRIAASEQQQLKNYAVVTYYPEVGSLTLGGARKSAAVARTHSSSVTPLRHESVRCRKLFPP